jgi:uncharacterized protein (TIGR03083 family)
VPYEEAFVTLPREQVVAGMISGYHAFAELINGLDDEQWQQPTRCSGWTVADVAAHVVGQLTDVVNFRLEGLGSPEVTERQVEERRGRSASELAEELTASTKLGADLATSFDDAAWAGPPGGGLTGTLGAGIEALWFDTYVHADDIRAAIGQPSVRDDVALLASVSHIVDVLSQGDLLQFVLVATGRADPATLGLDEKVNIYRS